MVPEVIQPPPATPPATNVARIVLTTVLIYLIVVTAALEESNARLRSKISTLQNQLNAERVDWKIIRDLTIVSN